MDLFRHGMRGPARPAPAVPGFNANQFTPVTNFENDPFGADLFEPTPLYTQKKKPPPRPPPPKINLKQPDVPSKPSHFIRKPTVLSTLLSRKSKIVVTNQTNGNQSSLLSDLANDVDANKMFPKCEPKNIQTGALIDLSSPPSSPTFTTRSSSDGLSVDSFGSDATTSTNHQNTHNGNASQAESGFEDDFDLFLHSKKSVMKEDFFDDFTAIDPFSPQANKPPALRKPVLNKDGYDIQSNVSQPAASLLKGPTIIRVKPARPKPPDNTAILKNMFSGTFPVTSMTLNTSVPIQKVNTGFGDSFESKPLSWDGDSSPERESSPPMPTIPPPPPPPVTDEELFVAWPDDVCDSSNDFPVSQIDFVANLSNGPVKLPDLPPKQPDLSENNLSYGDEEPYAIALFDYATNHADDLCFSANAKIKLIRRIDDEWLFGALKNGAQGIFPSNYVDIKVPLPNETKPEIKTIGVAVALYDFEPVQAGDLRFLTGDTISVIYKLNEEWYFGECNGAKGQFPINYVQMS